jgi:FkbM family methyltransferase
MSISNGLHERVISFLKKVVPDSVKHTYKMKNDATYRSSFKQQIELNRISKLPRYTRGYIHLLDRDLLFLDNASFIFMFDEIFTKGVYEFRSNKKSPLIIDCGANIGLSIIYFKTIFPEAEIIAFEPDPEIYNVLTTNAGLLDNVKFIKAALWNEETTVDFYSEGADSGRVGKIPVDATIIKIPTKRLRSYLNREIDFLKMDIEGAEVKVLIDCKEELKNVKNLFVEYHSFLGERQELSDLIKVLEESGFRYHINSPGISSKKPFVKLNTYNNMDMQLNIYAFKP